MCGVAGIYRPSGTGIDEHALRALVDRVSHRGPDDHGVWRDAHVGLGHTRLAILDLSPAAAQPMISADDRYVLSYNGETYNFPVMRRVLEGQGVPLRSTGDTEVLLEHLALFGVEHTVELLEGDWAFALWDRVERTLVLARDRQGVKPLYYTVGSSDDVRFASEIKALLDGRTQPDATSLNASLLGLSGTWEDRTLFEGVRFVCPGEYITFHGSTTPRRHRYFRLTWWADAELQRELAVASDEEIVRRVEGALEASLAGRLMSDAPLACLASGGVDSSLISSMAGRVQPDLSLYHADVLRDSERGAAEALARQLSLPLHVVTVSDQDFVDAVAEVTWHNDLPLIYHLNSVPFYLVSRLAASHGVKVLLTGEGSDEYFLGYPQHALLPMMDRIDGSKARFQEAAHALFPKASQLLWPKRSEEFAHLLRSLLFRFEEDIVAADSEAAFSFIQEPRMRRRQAMSLVLGQQHLVSLLHRNDRLGMAWGLESRFPFLGHDLVRLAINLPWRSKIRRTLRFHDRRHPFLTDKWVVREVAKRHVPGGLARRQKRGFPVSVFERLRIDPAFFAGGFVVNQYGLTDRAVKELHHNATPVWMMRLVLLEVWGQLFVAGQSVTETQALLRKNILTGS